MDKRQEMLYVYVQPFPRVHMSHLAQSVCAICFFHCDKFDCVSYQATATYKSPQPREDSNLIDGHLISPMRITGTASKPGSYFGIACEPLRIFKKIGVLILFSTSESDLS